jgi:pyruvate ferredoxin oxidoreductase gamma subunit
VRTSAPIETPDVVVVFHGALLRNPATFAGLRADGTLIYNAPAGTVADSLVDVPATARVIRVDALRIALEEQSRPNAVLLGTICAAHPFLRAADVLEALGEEFAGKHPEAVAANERAFHRGAREFEIVQHPGRAAGDVPPLRPEPVWGYRTQPIGGIVEQPGNSAWNDLSTSRTGWMPVLHASQCIHCGLCDLVCPDLCLVWGDGPADGKFARMLTGIDYRYCKGCLRCVESCPSGALQKDAETPGRADALRVPLFPDLIP